jgi:O-antigen/teichoic acid export membrane protein
MTQTTGRGSAVRRLGRAGAAVTAATLLTNGLAYLVPMLGARQLTAADLSALATVLALGAIASVPGFGLQVAIAVHRARYGPTPTTRLTVVTAALTGGVLLAAAPLITTTLHLPAALAALLTASTVASVLAGGWLGELQGEQRFVRLAVGMFLLAVGRSGGVIAGLVLGAGLTGSLLAGAVVGFLVLPVLARLTGPAAVPGGAPVPRSAALPPSAQPADSVRATAGIGAALGAQGVVTASAATLAVLAVSYADLILARQLLPLAESGAYSVGTVLTKGAIWAPQVVTVIALPRLAQGDQRTRTVALALVAACGAVLVIASALAGDLAFRLVGGADYVRLAGYAPYFAATGALYALVFVLVNAQVASGARRPAGPLWISVAALVAGAWFIAPHTFAGVLGSALTIAAVTTVVMGWLVLRRRPASP